MLISKQEKCKSIQQVKEPTKGGLMGLREDLFANRRISSFDMFRQYCMNASQADFADIYI